VEPRLERIVSKDALVVKQQTEQDDFDQPWTRGHRLGPLVHCRGRELCHRPLAGDPRTGEILDADIGFRRVWAERAAASWSRTSAGRRAERLRFSPIL